MIHASAFTASATRGRKTSLVVSVQFGSQRKASSSMCGMPSRCESCFAIVVLPEPVEPRTTMRFMVLLPGVRGRKYTILADNTLRASIFAERLRAATLGRPYGAEAF